MPDKKLTPELARQIRLSYNRGRSAAVLAQRYGVGMTTIQKLLNGESYQDVDPPRANVRRAGRPHGPSPQSRKLTVQEVRQLRAEYASGEVTYKDLCAHYGISPSTVYRWLYREE